MNKSNLQTPKGFRDFLPAQKKARDFVQKKLVEVFVQYGFEPLETPTLEYAELLLKKYGREADKLVYTFTDRGNREVGLRYDQTVPTSRVLAQYQHLLPKYFRRYQIQNVFRADKPQMGRYREFTQCDLDIFGSFSSLADAEILACTYQAFLNLGFKETQFLLNDRAPLFEAIKPFTSPLLDAFGIIQSLDKLDKQTPEQVKEELINKGLAVEQVESLFVVINKLSPSLELSAIIDQAQWLGVPNSSLIFSPTLARGLDYYTGLIFEIILPQYKAGSCGGGGRYDQLINQLCGVSIPAVGVGIGFDRTLEAATELGLVPAALTSSEIMVAVFSPDFIQESLQLATVLRNANIATTVFLEPVSLSKQYKYAHSQQIPWVIVIGEQEKAMNQVAI
ncbi:MAG TPA: histidine--tRNA ligase, partial [Candidatus Woesebacteria bacterium]|nr:histidine--tRNA ligase [Candidatus Woesebacteria bacterium]